MEDYLDELLETSQVDDFEDEDDSLDEWLEV